MPTDSRDSIDSIDKALVLRALRDLIAEDLAAATASHEQTSTGATHSEARSENAKDTRALEQTYLARGLAKRVEELRQAVLRLDSLELKNFAADDPVALGALVTVESDSGDAALYLLAPVGGGVRLEVSGQSVRIITLDSPMGSALIGKCVDDELQVRTPQGMRELTIVSLH